MEVSADAVLAGLYDELRGYAASDAELGPDRPVFDAGYRDVVVPLRLRTDHGVLSFFSTTTVFGTAVDITLSELAIESFFPADAATAEALRQALAPQRATPSPVHSERVASGV